MWSRCFVSELVRHCRQERNWLPGSLDSTLKSAFNPCGDSLGPVTQLLWTSVGRGSRSRRGRAQLWECGQVGRSGAWEVGSASSSCLAPAPFPSVLV